jgi:hypothetical protein
MFIIGISGKIGSGKDTFKDLLLKTFESVNIQAESRAFGHRVKEVVATLCQTSLDTQLSHEGKNLSDPLLNLSYGQIQQKVATALRDVLGHNIWIRLTLLPSFSEVLIISDVRFKIETEEIRKHPSFLIRLEGDPAGEGAKSTRPKDHISEVDLDDYEGWDLVIDNQPGIHRLQVYTNLVVASIMSQKSLTS